MVTDSFLPRSGGIELHVRDLSFELANSGHAVHILSPFAGTESIDGVRIDQVRAALWPRFQFAWTPSTVYRLEALLQAGNFDVVHHHASIFSPFTVASIGLCLQLGLPVVVTGHSLWREYAPALRFMDSIFSWSQKPLVLSGVSAAVAADLAPFAGRHKVELLPNGVDVAFWKTRAGPVERTSVVRIASVMRLARRKRPRVLLDIAGRLRRTLPTGTLFHLRIAGEGSERLHLERMLHEHSLSDVVTLLGAQSRTEVRTLLHNSDVFILPTAEEAFGIAALEARSAGVPVVALQTGGVGEIIRHNVEGLLAADDEELVTHTQTLLTNVALRERIAQHNEFTVPAEGWPSVIGKHEQVYELAVRRMGEGLA